MSEPGQNGEEEARPHKRLAIFETVNGKRINIGRLTVSKSDDEHANAKLEGATDETLEKIKYLVQPETMKGKVSGKEPLEKIIAGFQAMIEAEGYQTEELPEGDYQLQFTVDTNTGKLIGAQKALHPLASGPEDLINNVMKSISEGFANIPTKIAVAISEAAKVGDHAKAVKELEDAANAGKLGFAPNLALLEAILLINLKELNTNARDLVRDVIVRTASQLNHIDIAAEHAERILMERAGLTDFQKTDLEMIIAHAAAKAGHIETAMTIWRRLLKTPEKMDPESRGWAWRNVSFSLDNQSLEALETARRSADAFLEAGNKAEAGRSLMRVSKVLLYSDPQKAIDALNQIEALANKEGLLEKEMLAALYHARANRLSALGNHELALADALNAVELKRGIIGLEQELISSLYLIDQELHHLERHEEAKAYVEEAMQLTEATEDPHFKLANRVTALIANFDQLEAEVILEDARAAKNHEVASSVQVLIATLSPNLTDTQRLSKIEACLKEQDQKGFSQGAKAPARQALASQLLKMGELDRAEPWLKKLLAANPIDRWARDSLINTLWQQGKWGDAAIFIRQQIEVGGELPGLMWALGKSLLKAGALDDAVTVLNKAANLASSNPSLKANALELREEAIQLGGTVRAPKDEPPPDTPITSVIFEQALEEFCRFVKADKRMTFWKKEDDSDYDWIPSPEGYAQTLLHTYLKGKFSDRIGVFEEIKTGAGRIDIYVQLKGGLSVVVELKMCGFRYSTSYAASGEEQVIHYMENKSTALGYLVVFDSRLEHNGEKIMPGRAADKYTVKELICDVRPRFGKKAKGL